MLELTLLLLQSDYSLSPGRFFAAFFLILIIFCLALLFTYWIAYFDGHNNDWQSAPAETRYL